MGTNYYIQNQNKCPTCGHAEEDDIHIGKSSAGWKFLFNAIQYKSFDEWLPVLQANSDFIYDEYKKKHDLDQFLEFIESKKDGMSDEDYYLKYPEHRNGFEPNNWCDGTYRYCGREFS